MPKEHTRQSYDEETDMTTARCGSETKVARLAKYRTITAWSAYPDRFDKVAETPVDQERFEGDTMDIRISGNDIEIDGEKVARIFDIRATLMSKLEEAVKQASRDLDAEFKEEGEVNYESGRAHGFAEGKEHAQSQLKGAHEQD
jgi:flagellar biosynthesis/type III secretory pathway protein FliH